MGLISGRLIIVVIAVCLCLGWGAATGLVVYGKNSYECYGGKSLQPVGSPMPWLWIGKLKLKYQPFEWGCDKDHQYDPKQYKVVDGLLQPTTPGSLTP